MGASQISVIADCAQTEVVRTSGASKPARESDLEAWKHNELLPSRMRG
jgi:hypothetical protein